MIPAPARLAPRHLTRPVVRALDVTTTLADFAIVTFAVAPEALARHLGPGFTPDVRTLDDGRQVALVSAVPFRDLDFSFGLAPWARFRMGQTNYRAYVRRPDGAPSVWFFGTTLTGPTVVIPRLLWRLPWHPARMRFDVAWHGEVCTRYRLEASSAFAPLSMELAGTDTPMGRLDGFADEEDTLVVLTHPLDGYFFRSDGHVGTYDIWHDRLSLRRGHLTRGGVPLFERLGLVEPGQVPHSVLLQRETRFVIRLPPRRLQA